MTRCVALRLLALLLVSPLALSQTAGSVVAKDPTAIAVIQRSLAAMGCNQALASQDSLATGQAQIALPDGSIQTFPIVKKAMGATLIRTELQRPEGVNVRIVNNGAAAIVRPDGSAKRLIGNNVMAERVDHIPCLSFLAEFEVPSIEVDYLGTDSVQGQAVDVVSLSLTSATDPHLKSITSTRFLISRTTGMDLGIQYQTFAENNTNLSDTEQILFSDFRVVNGVLTPFQEADFSNGTLHVLITYSSVNFNTGVSISDFILPNESEN